MSENTHHSPQETREVQSPFRSPLFPSTNDTPIAVITRHPFHPLTPIQTLWHTLRQSLPTDTAMQQADDPTTLSQAQAQWKNLFQSRRTAPPILPDGNRPIIMSHANQRANHPWGDLLQEKASHHTRIYAMNVNGLTLDRRGGQFDAVCEIQ